MGAEAELREPEVLVEDEPRYLRRQKPVEVRRRKFGKRAWQTYAKIAAGVAGVVVAGALVYFSADFLFNSPRMQLAEVEAIQLAGNQFVPRSVVLEKFAADRGSSTLEIPLDERRAALEEIPWVERASVRRILPNGIRVELIERTPVAFLRVGPELALIDAYGVILERPLEGDFHFPVVTGISDATPRDDRAARMKLFTGFLKEIELARAGATDQVSEVDLSDASDLRATLADVPELGNPSAEGQASVLVHFGEKDFTNKFRVFVENVTQWRATVGRLDSVDLRFSRQVVVNPETQSAGTRAPETFSSTPKLR